MYSAVPPRPGGQADPGNGWGLLRTARRAFPEHANGGCDADRTAQLDTYLTDLLDPFGLKLEPGVLESGGHAYGEMGRALIEEVVSEDDAVDLLVLAYAVPDTHPGRATAVYLSHVCPGRPMAFAISDQGVGAAFTGLRLIREYAASGGPRRSVLLVLEQAALPYDPGCPVVLPTVSAGVALLFGDPAGGSAAPLDETLRIASVGAGRSDEALADLGDGAVAIVGTGLAAHDRRPAGLDHVLRAPAGQPVTGVWWELAGLLASAGSALSRRVVLADVEPSSRSQYLAVFDVERAGIPA